MLKNIAEAFLKQLAVETEYLSSSLHVEMKKASSTEPTGTTTSNTGAHEELLTYNPKVGANPEY